MPCSWEKPENRCEENFCGVGKYGNGPEEDEDGHNDDHIVDAAHFVHPVCFTHHVPDLFTILHHEECADHGEDGEDVVHGRRIQEVGGGCY